MVTVIVLETNTTKTTIEIVTKIRTKAETDIEMTAMTKLEVGLKKKITYMMRMTYLTQKLKECTKFYK